MAQEILHKSEEILDRLGDFLQTRKPWYELPLALALPALISIRDELRAQNLHDTEQPPLSERAPTQPIPEIAKEQRLEDGSFNDCTYPQMGAENRRFGRNFPLDEVHPDTANLLNPNPRDVSQLLLARTDFKPATIVNLLAANWIQFMVHDWFAHKTTPTREVQVPVRETDPWPEKPMRFPASELDAATPGSTHPPAFANENTHWWDASQLYGCDDATCSNIRTHSDGKLRVSPEGRIPVNPQTGLEITGFTDNNWIGLSMLHGLFALEHNAVCDVLKSKYPDWTDEQLFQKARLINTATIAKIHTVEWTPAIVPHPTVQFAMHTNWFGVVPEKLQEVLKFTKDNEVLGGIIGSPTNHFNVPYSLTEEFVSVYRMHPLIPDTFTFRSATTGEVLGTYELADVALHKGRAVFEEISPADLFYSFGVSYPGAVRLHNYPRGLQNLVKDDGTRVDLASIEIYRDRERGVPRYNQFRRLLRKEPVKSFEELTGGDQALADEIRKVYNNDLELVDLMVGLYAEPLPEGFGFSETAFRIFILMASRRLNSDRFFTADYRPEVYTEEGIEWVRNATMSTILKRHFPQISGALEGVANPFTPWKAAGKPLTATAMSTPA
jgi:hypothetical protein